MSDKIYLCPYPPEWYASQAYARTLPLVAVTARWVEVDAADLEAVYAAGGRVGPYSPRMAFREALACGHVDDTRGMRAKSRRCWQCGAVAS
jgi:hypothetical protein